MSRDALLKKINALRSRTTARGCTEAEAMEAAAKAAAIMREHGIDDDSLQMSEKGAPIRNATRSSRARLWPVIATLTNTAAITIRTQVGREIAFVGREPWPDIALYVFDVCNTAIDSETKKFRAGEFYRRRRSAKTKRLAVDDFTIGLVLRLRSRLVVLFAETRSASSGEKAMQERDRRYPDARSANAKEHKTRFEAAQGLGWRAGGDVHLSHGVGQERSELLLIGGLSE